MKATLLYNSTLAGNDIFYSENPAECPDHVKYKYKAKFEEKLLVWVAICPKGLSNLYFVPSKQAINQKVYLQKCLIERLIPMTRKFYGNSRQFVFWPDLASSHFAKSVQNFLKSKKIKFVSKENNPANTPEARPIEDFWSEFKRSVYKNNWVAKDIDQLKNRILYCYSKIDKEIFLKYTENVSRRLNRIAKYGL